MIRPRLVVISGLAMLALLVKALPGQGAPGAGVSADSVRPARARKSPAAAAAFGLVLPGAGHWYAGERGRGTLIGAVYWVGVALVAGGRTDRVGQVGGVAFLGSLGVSVIDGARAAARFNRRQARGTAPPPGLGTAPP